MTVTAPAAPLTTLTAQDRCDQCGGQAQVAVKFPRIPGELLFCAHHMTHHEASIKEKRGRIILDLRQQALDEAAKHPTAVRAAAR